MSYKIWGFELEFPGNESGSRKILPCIFYRDLGIPGPRDEIPGAEFAKQGGPRPEIVYSITIRETVINDYINQLYT